MQYMSVCAFFMQVPNMVHISPSKKVFQGTGNMGSLPCGFRSQSYLNFVFDPLLIFESDHSDGTPGSCTGYCPWIFFIYGDCFFLLVFTKQKVRIKIKGFHVDSHMLKNLFSYGFPSFVMNALGSFLC